MSYFSVILAYSSSSSVSGLPSPVYPGRLYIDLATKVVVSGYRGLHSAPRDSSGRRIGREEMRQLKHHEKKLIKKVDLFNWKSDRTIREAEVELIVAP